MKKEGSAISTWPGDEAAQYQTRPDEQAYGQVLPVPAEQARPAATPDRGQAMVYQHVQPHSATLAVVASFSSRASDRC